MKQCRSLSNCVEARVALHPAVWSGGPQAGSGSLILPWCRCQSRGRETVLERIISFLLSRCSCRPRGDTWFNHPHEHALHPPARGAPCSFVPLHHFPKTVVLRLQPGRVAGGSHRQERTHRLVPMDTILKFSNPSQLLPMYSEHNHARFGVVMCLN